MFVSTPLLDAISTAASVRIRNCTQPQDLGKLARALWVLTYEQKVWGPMLYTHLGLMEDDLVLGTLDRIPRKFGVSKEAIRDRRLLPEGYEATTNWWKTAQVAPRAKTVVEVPGITDRRLVGVIKAFREIGGEMAYGFINCPEIMEFCNKDIFVRSCHVLNFRVGDVVSFRVIFKEERRPEAVELRQPSDATGGKDIRINETELTQKGYLIHTTKFPDDNTCSPQFGDTVCVSYTARLALDGTVFDAAKNFKFTLGIGSVIFGLEKGVAEMSLGQEVRLIVHHMYAYGEIGAPTSKPIPPLANLDFDLMLLGIEKPDQHNDQWQKDDFYAVNIGKFEQYFDEANITFYNDNGTENTAAENSDGRPIRQLTRGRQWRCLMGIAMNHSVKSWLLAIDKQGTLLNFQDKLQREYNSVHDIVSVYTKVNLDGSTTIEPEFFEDMGVTKTASRRLFQKWFECPMG